MKSVVNYFVKSHWKKSFYLHCLHWHSKINTLHTKNIFIVPVRSFFFVSPFSPKMLIETWELVPAFFCAGQKDCNISYNRSLISHCINLSFNKAVFFIICKHNVQVISFFFLLLNDHFVNKPSCSNFTVIMTFLNESLIHK